MSFTSAVSTLATVELQLRELPMPPWVFGAIAFGSLLLLLGVLWSFRNTAAKYYTPRVGHGDAHHSQGTQGSQGSPGSTGHGAHH